MLRTTFIALLAAMLLSIFTISETSAHPLGNFTINHYSRLEFSPNQLRIFFVLDLAEIPTFQEKQNIDTNGDGTLSDDERARYLTTKVEDLRRKLQLQVNGKPIELSLVPDSVELSYPPGQGGLSFMRLSALFTAPLSGFNGQSLTVNYRDDNYKDRIGWREIVLRADDPFAIVQSNVHSKGTSDQLRNYPQDLLSQPLNDREADLILALAGSGSNLSPAGASSVSETANIFGESFALPIIPAAIIAALIFIAAFFLLRSRQGHRA